MIDNERSLQRYARLAGGMYIFSMAVFIGHFAAIGSIHVAGDFVGTARSIAASETVYRIGLAALLLGALTVAIIGWAFYGLLKPIDPNLALFGFAMRLAEATLVAVGVILRFAALDTYLVAPQDGAALGHTLSELYAASYHIGGVFLSAGSMAFFALLYRSRFIPRLLAGFCFVASTLFGVQAFAHLVVPDLAEAVGLVENLPMFITEIGTGLWLLLRGADFRWRRTQTAR
jgi:hypothetical protein